MSETPDTGERLAIEEGDDPTWMSLRLRMKLDLVGLKISLVQWQKFATLDRGKLNAAPAETATDTALFAAMLTQSMTAAGLPAPVALAEKKLAGRAFWNSSGPTPAVVVDVCEAAGLDPRWAELDRFGRFVVFHLASRGDVPRLRGALSELLVG
ncbi:MAG: hypothetical protein ACI91F_001146 [Candidatus Binatia bacterium]|jgi:hypothetical protein